jgi:Sec-independent protein translocase protein TatA
VFNLDPAKLLVIGMLALIVLGPERLPKVARQLGGAWRELTRLRDQVSDEVRTAFPIDDLPRIPNASNVISTAVSNLTRPLTGSGARRDLAQPEDVGGGTVDPPNNNTARTRRAPEVVVHPALGEFAFLPDDPSMN